MPFNVFNKASSCHRALTEMTLHMKHSSSLFGQSFLRCPIQKANHRPRETRLYCWSINMLHGIYFFSRNISYLQSGILSFWNTVCIPSFFPNDLNNSKVNLTFRSAQGKIHDLPFLKKIFIYFFFFK